MGREAIVSSGDALRIISLEDGHEALRMPFERADALCASESGVFCACRGVIWRLDRRTLAPSGLFGGGPGVSSLLLSQDGKRLYALCGEADSVLMLDAQTGEALLLNRSGVNPREMTLDGDVLAVAGGESGLLILLCAQTLRVLNALAMPGPVYSLALGNGKIHALCLSAALTSLLVTQGPSGDCCVLELAGMPGRLLLGQNRLLAATEGALYAISPDGKRIMGKACIPGRAVWLAGAGKETLMLDGYTDSLYIVKPNGLKLICANTASASLDDV